MDAPLDHAALELGEGAANLEDQLAHRKRYRAPTFWRA
jgi:hypothetical protein